MSRRGVLAGLVVVATTAPVAAEPPTARATGRAGTGLVSDDGLGAILTSPAALARRDARRAQLALEVRDDDVRAARDGARTAGSGQAPSWRLGLAAADALGPMVVGVALVTDDAGRALPAPPAETPLPSIAGAYLDRYAGLAARRAERTLAVAAAARVRDWLAIGVGATLASVRFEERRRVWAGFTGRDELGDPARDLDLDLGGDDGLVPGASFGALLAPASVPLELAASVGWRNDVHVDGAAAARGVAGEVTVDAARGAGRLTLASPVIARAGARWLAERWSLEVGGELHRYPAHAATPTWALRGVRVVDRAGPAVDVTAVASRAGRQRHGAVRGAVDVEVLEGLAWVTLGYAWASAATPDDAVAATLAELGGHAVALGLEASAGDVTLTVGWSHAWASRAVATSTLGYDDPFAPAGGDVGVGRYAASADRLGLGVELAWP